MNKIYWILVAVVMMFLVGCSNDDEQTIRSENDVYGAWIDNKGDYFYFKYPNICYKLVPAQSDDEYAELYYD